MVALYVILGLLVGIAFGWLAASLRASSRNAQQQGEISGLSARLELLGEDLAGAEKERDEALTNHRSASEALSFSRSENAHLSARLEAESRRSASMQEQMKLEFESLANRLLEEKSAKFLDQNHQHLRTLIEPLRERIGEFRERLEVIHTEEEKSVAALGSQLRHLHELNRQVAEEAGNLASALKGESKTQGSWGELVLERILEKSGLVKGSEYETQASLRDGDGGRRMPDVVVRLPEGKCLIIDAKVSLTAYERAVNAEDDPERKASLREHAVSVRRHVDELSRKGYAALVGSASPDFVLMFVPVEPALTLAMEHDPALYGDAFEKNVVLVSSSTLLVALRAVESVWRHHKQTVNAQEIARQAGNLHDAFVLFLESLEEVGSRLDQARTAFDQARARLATGKGNLVRRTMELQKLGARAEKQLPDNIARLAGESGE